MQINNLFGYLRVMRLVMQQIQHHLHRWAFLSPHSHTGHTRHVVADGQHRIHAARQALQRAPTAAPVSAVAAALAAIRPFTRLVASASSACSTEPRCPSGPALAWSRCTWQYFRPSASQCHSLLHNNSIKPTRLRRSAYVGR